MFCKAKLAKNNYFLLEILDHFKTKMFKSGTTSFFSFPQGFQISKKIGHLTLGSGGKNMFKRYLKNEHTDRQTDRQTDKSTYKKH